MRTLAKVPSGHLHLMPSGPDGKTACGRRLTKITEVITTDSIGRAVLDVTCGKCRDWTIRNGYMTWDCVLTPPYRILP